MVVPVPEMYTVNNSRLNVYTHINWNQYYYIVFFVPLSNEINVSSTKRNIDICMD